MKIIKINKLQIAILVSLVTFLSCGPYYVRPDYYEIYNETALNNLQYVPLYISAINYTGTYLRFDELTYRKLNNCFYNAIKSKLIQQNIRIKQTKARGASFYILRCTCNYLPGAAVFGKGCNVTVKCEIIDPYKSEGKNLIYTSFAKGYDSFKITRSGFNEPMSGNCGQIPDIFRKAVDGLAYFFDNVSQGTPSEKVYVKVVGYDDGATTTKTQDYKEAVFDAKLKAAAKAGSRIISEQRLKISVSEKSTYSQHYDRNTELQIDSILLPGFKIYDHGYESGYYKVTLEGYIVNN